VVDIRVMIADDEAVVRDALTDLVNGSPGMIVVAATANADETIAEAARVQPDVALVDVRMPGGGATATRGILRHGSSTRVLAFSASDNRDTVFEMLQAGAAGYVLKGTPPADVIDGIRRVAAGQSPISAEVAGSVVDQLRTNLDAETLDENHRQLLLGQLSRALNGNALDMVYQPILDLESRQLVGLEALARFSMKPYRPPNEWFAVAANLGLATELQLRAFSRALDARAQLPPGTFLAVNLSPVALMSPALAPLIPSDFASRLVVELTEHTPVVDYPALAQAFAPLRAMDVGLAVDDAGAGFASLRHILELGPEFIKLDISITQKIETDAAARALAVALTSFAGAIDVRIVAEGIETESHVVALKALGIKLGQGYHLGRPAPIAWMAS